MNAALENVSSHLHDLPRETVDSRRLFHGRGHQFPGLEFLTIDLFDPILLITFFNSPPNDWEKEFVKRIQEILKNTRLHAAFIQRRYLKEVPTDLIYGSLPAETFAQRGNLRFHLKLGQRQNTGFFLDMEPGRVWLENNAHDANILNLFSYTCAFSVVALGAGAKHVFNVDMSRSALNQGRDNHRLNKLPSDQSSYFDGNVFKSWGRIRRKGPYDIVIIDPPSYQPGSFIAKKDYAKVIKRLPQLLAPKGQVLACLNAPELDTNFLKDIFSESCPECEFIERLTPSKDFSDTNENRQLKLLTYRYAPEQ